MFGRRFLILAALTAVGAAVGAAVLSLAHAGAQEPPCGEGGQSCSMSVDKSRVGSGTVEVDDLVTYDVVITNTGQVPLVDVDVTDLYTLHLDFDEADPDPNLWLGDDGLLQWYDLENQSAGELGPGESVSLTVVFAAVQTGTAENCVQVLAGPASDPNFLVESNFDCTTTSVSGTAPTPDPGDDNDRPERIPTPTPRASVTAPAPTSTTVATSVPGATVVAPAPTLATGVIITGPDTGQGGGTGERAQWPLVLALSLLAVVGACAAGLGVLRARTRS